MCTTRTALLLKTCHKSESQRSNHRRLDCLSNSLFKSTTILIKNIKMTAFYTLFAKSNGRFFFSDTKINLIPSSNLYDFGGCIKCMQVVISSAKWIYFLHYPFCTGGLNVASAMFFKSSLNVTINSLVKFNGFKWNFLNFKLDTCF